MIPNKRRTTQSGIFLAFITAFIVSGCAFLERENEQDIPLSEVPAAVLNTAKAAVAGIEFDEAELEEEDGQLVYELEGEAGGKEYEIEVSADGELLEVEEKD